MALSTMVEAPTSSVVGNAHPPVTMEGKMVVATGHGNCQQLKDILSNKDSSTMVVVMASSNHTSSPEPRLPAMDARAVACSGSFQDMESILNREDHQASQGISKGASDDEEAFLGESLLSGVTAGGDTALHVIATNGDCEDFLNKARIIHIKAQNLLFMQNNKGDTPLHCAARAANSQMVSLLIDLARGEDDNAHRVTELLEIENKIKWTVLHEAICIANNDMVKLLMKEDSKLANFPKDGTSPLYLAILLENKIIAETLYELNRGVLSYSGPNGQNALHAAVLRDEGLTEMLLEWKDDLTLQQDENGSTPLHFAAAGRRDVCSQLLNTNQGSLYQADYNGSFPTHVAASDGAAWVMSLFLKKSPNCAGLRDARGRTCLHVAVEKMKIRTVNNTCINISLPWILNMQDNDGNTALHLAVQVGSLRILYSLLEKSEVHLNLTNGKGETPLDIACHNLPKGLYDNENSEARILSTLNYFGAKRGICRRDYFKENDNVQVKHDEIQEMEKVKDTTQSLCIGSVLIATVTFGAAFAVPGGYRADDHTNGGTPTLVGRFGFNAFTLANTLAFSSSTMATVALMSAGSPMKHLRFRTLHLRIAYVLMSVSVKCLVTAFALGTFMMLAPVAYDTATAVYSLSFIVLGYQYWELMIKHVLMVKSLYRRKGIILTFWMSMLFLVVDFLTHFWPCIAILCFTLGDTPVRKMEPSVQPPTPLT